MEQEKQQNRAILTEDRIKDNLTELKKNLIGAKEISIGDKGLDIKIIEENENNTLLQINYMNNVLRPLVKNGRRYVLRSDGTLIEAEGVEGNLQIIGIIKIEAGRIFFTDKKLPLDKQIKQMFKEENKQEIKIKETPKEQDIRRAIERIKQKYNYEESTYKKKKIEGIEKTKKRKNKVVKLKEGDVIKIKDKKIAIEEVKKNKVILNIDGELKEINKFGIIGNEIYDITAGEDFVTAIEVKDGEVRALLTNNVVIKKGKEILGIEEGNLKELIGEEHGWFLASNEPLKIEKTEDKIIIKKDKQRITIDLNKGIIKEIENGTIKEIEKNGIKVILLEKGKRGIIIITKQEQELDEKIIKAILSKKSKKRLMKYILDRVKGIIALKLWKKD